MAGTYTNGLTMINSCDTTTGWSTSHGSVLTVGTSKVEGTNSIIQWASAGSIQRILTLDMTSEDLSGEWLWFWNVTTSTSIGTVNDKDDGTNPGFQIQLEDTAGNWSRWNTTGIDVEDEDYIRGGWRRYTMDPLANSPDSTSGTLDSTIVQFLRIRLWMTATATGGPLVDYVARGRGFTCTGGGSAGTPLTWNDVSAFDRTNAIGCISIVGNLVFLQGEITFDSTVSNIFFKDTRRIIFANGGRLALDRENVLYDETTPDYPGVVIRESGAFETHFTYGNNTAGIVSDGCYTAPQFYRMIFDVGAITEFRLYDSVFVDQDTILFPVHTTSREAIGNKFVNSSEIDPQDMVFKQNTMADAPGSSLLLDTVTHRTEQNKYAGNVSAINFSVAGTYTLDADDFSGNTPDCINSANAVTVDSYPDSNQSGTQTLGNGTIVGVSQSFTNTTAGTLSNARFHLSKTLSPTGNAVAKLYTINNAIGGGDDIPTVLLATSETFDVSTLTGTLTLTQFPFTDEFPLAATTDYVIALEYSGGDASNFVNVGTDTTAPTHTGNFATLTGTTWTAVSGTDGIFFVSRDGIVSVNTINSANPITFTATGSPPSTVVINNNVTLSLSGVTEGTPVRFEAAETVGTRTTGDLLSQGFANNLGVLSFSIKYEDAFEPSGFDFRIVARNQGVAVAAIAENTPAFTDETLEASDSTTNDMTLLPAVPVVNDAYYFGHNEQFNRLKVDVSTVLTFSSQPTIVWEYWNGAWVALSGVVDGTSGFEIAGENIISFTLPGDWATTTINSQGPLSYVRARLSVAGTITQVPLGSKATLDTTRYFFYDVIRTAVSGTGFPDVANWTIDSISKFSQTD